MQRNLVKLTNFVTFDRFWYVWKKYVASAKLERLANFFAINPNYGDGSCGKACNNFASNTQVREFESRQSLDFFRATIFTESMSGNGASDLEELLPEEQLKT